MFSGLVQALGKISRIDSRPGGVRLGIHAVRLGMDDVAIGDSIAVNGVCLTVREFGAGTFTVGAVVTTLDRTAIGAWTVGTRLNLERAMALGDRLGMEIAFRGGPRGTRLPQKRVRPRNVAGQASRRRLQVHGKACLRESRRYGMPVCR